VKTNGSLLFIYIYTEFEGSHMGLIVETTSSSGIHYKRVGQFNLLTFLCKETFLVDEYKTITLV
jgi:hypothetical protein